MTGIPLAEAKEAIVYNAPSTSKALLKTKRPSYKKGEYPEHLKKFAADKTSLAKCPIVCKGKTGMGYSACLRTCAEATWKAPPGVAPAPK